MLAALSLLVTVAAALDPSQCTRSDAALSTSTLTDLAAFSALAPVPSRVSASSEGLAIVADGEWLSGMVSNSRWALPVELALSWKADNVHEVAPNSGIWANVGGFAFSDATSTPDKEHAALGCSEVGLSMTGLDEYMARFKCCGDGCAAPDGKLLMDGDDWNATSGMLSWRGGPMVNETHAWKVQIATDSAAFIYSDVTHGLSSTKGNWPGGELTLGFDMFLADKSSLPTLSIQSLAITGCAVGVTQTAVAADPLSTGPVSTPPPTVVQGSGPSTQTTTTTGSDHQPTVKIVLNSGGSKEDSSILIAILALVVIVAI